MAPSGFPSFLDLRQAIILLDNANSILGVDHQHDKFTVATMAAEKWRLMCKHVYNRARSTKSDIKSDELKPLWGMIKGGDADEEDGDAPQQIVAAPPEHIVAAAAQHIVLDADKVAGMFPEFGQDNDEVLIVDDDMDADLMFLDMVCNCPECKKGKTEEGTSPSACTMTFKQRDVDSAVMDSTKKLPIPDPRSQHVQTKHRLSIKQAAPWWYGKGKGKGKVGKGKFKGKKSSRASSRAASSPLLSSASFAAKKRKATS